MERFDVTAHQTTRLHQAIALNLRPGAASTANVPVRLAEEAMQDLTRPAAAAHLHDRYPLMNLLPNRPHDIVAIEDAVRPHHVLDLQDGQGRRT